MYAYQYINTLLANNIKSLKFSFNEIFKPCYGDNVHI